MLAWSAQTNVQVLPQEWEALRLMDQAYLKGYFKEPEAVPPPPDPRISKRELSFELFDALWDNAS